MEKRKWILLPELFLIFATLCSKFSQVLLVGTGAETAAAGVPRIPVYVHDGQIKKKIMTDYDKNIRPAVDFKVPTIVDFDITLSKINELDELRHVLSTSVFLYKSWFDSRLTWNKSEFRGLDKIKIPLESLWKPDIALFNVADQSFDHIYGADAFVTSDGGVVWTPMLAISSWCQLDFSKFPFDTQICYMYFGSWSYDAGSIQLRLAIDPNATEVDGHVFNYGEDVDSEWQIFQFKQSHRLVKYHEVIPEWSEISVKLVMRRAGRYYQNLYVAPIVLLSLLTPMVFLLPPDASEKPILGSLLLLSICGILVSFQAVLQPSRYSMPRLVMFYVSSLILASMSVFASAVVCNIAKRSKRMHGVPAWLGAIFLGRCGLRRVLCVESYSPVNRFDALVAMGDDLQSEEEDGGTEMTGPVDSPTHKELRQIRKCLHALAGRLNSDESISHLTRDWYEIARVLDRFLLVIFYFILFLTALAFLL